MPWRLLGSFAVILGFFPGDYWEVLLSFWDLLTVLTPFGLDLDFSTYSSGAVCMNSRYFPLAHFSSIHHLSGKERHV